MPPVIYNPVSREEISLPSPDASDDAFWSEEEEDFVRKNPI